jgi:hypothetical protein
MPQNPPKPKLQALSSFFKYRATCKMALILSVSGFDKYANQIAVEAVIRRKKPRFGAGWFVRQTVISQLVAATSSVIIVCPVEWRRCTMLRIRLEMAADIAFDSPPHGGNLFLRMPCKGFLK